MIGSYGKIYQLGHAQIRDIFQYSVEIEEKVDGSQFSFGVIDGVLRCRSKNVEIIIEDNNYGMFDAAVESVLEIKDNLKTDYIYRGEYLKNPRHNSLTYNRIPVNHIVIYDIDTGVQNYLDPIEKEVEAERIGLDCVPQLRTGVIQSLDDVKELLERESFLGGPNIEGFVVKAYGHFGADKKTLMGKFVSEAFKEVNKKQWAVTKHREIKEILSSRYRTIARWEKAVQHMREDGVLTDSPKDIGELIKYVKADVKKECEDEIKEELFKWAWGDIQKSLGGGLPQWYKEKLAEESFTKASV